MKLSCVVELGKKGLGDLLATSSSLCSQVILAKCSLRTPVLNDLHALQ